MTKRTSDGDRVDLNYLMITGAIAEHKMNPYPDIILKLTIVFKSWTAYLLKIL